MHAMWGCNCRTWSVLRIYWFSVIYRPACTYTIVTWSALIVYQTSKLLVGITWRKSRSYNKLATSVMTKFLMTSWIVILSLGASWWKCQCHSMSGTWESKEKSFSIIYEPFFKIPTCHKICKNSISHIMTIIQKPFGINIQPSAYILLL